MQGYFEESGAPFKGRKLEKLKSFLKEAELDYDENIEYTVNLTDLEGRIVATGSVHDNVLKCIAVSKACQGEGLAGRILTLLLNYTNEKNRRHVFLFTKPGNAKMFQDLGFYKVVETKDVLFMENEKAGIEQYLKNLKRPQNPGTVGCIVANMNPFTSGHRYLIETAATNCDTLHLFVLSENKSEFSNTARYHMAQVGTADLKNVYIHETSDYLISSAVFPTYFIKDKVNAEHINCELDVRIFCEKFAKELGITKRFVGTEPFCQVTGKYNQTLQKILPEYGIELVEIARKEEHGRPISASDVRELLAAQDFEAVKALVPETTFSYIVNEKLPNK